MTPPSQIAHYHITAKLGEGGMGAVYRATDTKLNRDVAIKVLPEAFAADADRLARFTREAQVLAALNHPNIAAIYGVEERALVMELVEGDELRTPLPIAAALDCARQIAEALEAAHDKGIVHRDLKPANIKITPQGTVKVLDFGLAAVAQDPAPASASQAVSPTLTMRATQAGMIMGTAAYMSPEQAAGKPVDKRADIWSFGVVLWEMLAGRQMFGGETISHTLADVLRAPIDLAALPADTPPAVRRLLGRCLDRNPRNRLRDIGEVRVAFESAGEEEMAHAPQAQAKRSWLPWAIAGVAVAAGIGGLSVAWMRPGAPAGLHATFPLNLPAGALENPVAEVMAAPSPDGRQIAFVANSADGRNGIWVRTLNSSNNRFLENTAGATVPFWSPDGQYIAFFVESKLKKVRASGGLPQTLGDGNTGGVITSGNGGTWSQESGIVIGRFGQEPLMHLPATGGQSRAVFALDAGAGEVGQSWPQFLPDGRHLLYFSRNRDPEKSGLMVQELGSKQRVEVMRSRYRGAWSQPGLLVFPRGEGTLFAQRMDSKTFRLSGEPVAIAENVTSNAVNGRSAFAVSLHGVLVYKDGSMYAGAQIGWYDRAGNRLAAAGKPGHYASIRLSPDEKRVAVVQIPSTSDQWVLDLATGSLSRATSSGNVDPVPGPGPWSPDSERFIVNYGAAAEAEEFTAGSGNHRRLSPGCRAEDWSPDGRFVICNDLNSRQLSTLSVENGARPQLLGETPYARFSFRFSPDGKRVAFTSEESGRREIFVAAFPSFAEKRQVSVDGGAKPAWRRDGKELFFMGSDSTLMSVAIGNGPKLEAGVPKPLFKIDSMSQNTQNFSPSGDGQRFLVLKGERGVKTMVSVNWTEALKLP